MVSKADHARGLNGLIGSVQERWAAKILKMDINCGSGIDLIDKSRNLGVEVKGITPDSSAWTVQNHQLKYNEEGMRCFWFLGLYDFDRSIQSINIREANKIEEMIVWRDFRLVYWEWVKQFEEHRTSGSGARGSWNNNFRYAKRIDLPRTYKKYEVDTGIVRLTSGVPKNLFHEDIISGVPF